MSAWWNLLQAVCLACLTVAVAVRTEMYDDEIEVNYSDSYYNEINEGEQGEAETPTEPPAPPCSAPEFTKWDKLFTMLENSQMKENMLLQYSDDIVRVELQTLRGELLQFAARYGDSCSAAVEGAARRANGHSETRVLGAVERLQAAAVDMHVKQEVMLTQIREAGQQQVEKLAEMEELCKEGGRLKKVEHAKSFQTRQANQEMTEDGSLARVMAEVQSLREQLEAYVRATSTRVLPAGCDMALFFPMRSPKTHAELIPHVSMQTRAITVCLWAKPTQTSQKTVLFSYGTAENPLELQLLLSDRNALFTVGGEAHLVEARDSADEGRWVHLCGTWSSEQGLASLWVDGRLVASSPGVAEGHEIPEKGVLILGQEYEGVGLAKRFGFGFQDVSDAEEAFTGKMTGVNVWSRVLTEDEISELARLEGRGCGKRGNLVAWGVTQVVAKGGVELLF